MNEPLVDALGLLADRVRGAGEPGADPISPEEALDLCTAVQILRSLLRRGEVSIRCMGAPGDWGYSHPIGAALARLWKQPLPKVPADRDVGFEDLVFCEELLAEVRRARDKFPGTDLLMAALTEETGEVATALLDESAARVRSECVQAAAVALRIHGSLDSSFAAHRKAKGLEP